MFCAVGEALRTRIDEDDYIELRQPASYQPKIDVEPEFEISSDEIERLYRRDGYLGPFDVLSPEEIETLRTHLLDTLIPSESPWKYEVCEERNFVEWLFKHEQAALAEVRQKVLGNYGGTVNRHLDDRRLRELFTRREITARCAQLLGPDLLLSRSNFFQVKGKTRGTHLHQASHWLFDDMRHSIVTPAKPSELWQLTCWIALTDTNEENGGLLVLPGTQDKMYPLIIDRNSNYFDPAFPYRVGDIELPPDAPEPRPIPVKAGQFILFTERVMEALQGDVAGIDFARDKNGRLWLLEVNVAFETNRDSSLAMFGNSIWEKTVDLAEARTRALHADHDLRTCVEM